MPHCWFYLFMALYSITFFFFLDNGLFLEHVTLKAEFRRREAGEEAPDVSQCPFPDLPGAGTSAARALF